jgi:hypothetical protein
MEFINEVTPTSQNEPRIEVSVNEDQINEVLVFPHLTKENYHIFNCFDFNESDDDDLVLFGVGGPA